MSSAPVDPQYYRSVVGRFATGVTVLTTVGADGSHHAMTANAFTSVSLDPVLVLVCIEKAARFHPPVLASGVWGLSVLGAGHEDLSRRFATRGRPLTGHPFEGLEHTLGPATGVLLLHHALATLEARTTQVIDGGDHTVLLGEVLTLDMPRSDHAPLVWFEGGYRTLA